MVQGGFATEAAAKAWQHGLRTDEDALNEWLGHKLQGSKITVAQALAYYYEKHARRLAAADRCEDHARHLCEHLGDEQAAALRQHHVDAYIAARSDSAKTAFNELAYLRSALLYAWRCDRLHDRPRFRLARPHCERTRVAWPDEAQRLYAAAELPMQRVILAAYSMGLRRGEIIAARWSWVQGRLLVLPADETKTRTEAAVEIPELLWSLLEQEPRHSDWLFVHWGTRNGKGKRWPARYYASSLQREWKRTREAIGAPDLHLHDLRRSMSSVGQARGHSRAAVRAVGRWADAATMDRHYSHAAPHQAADVGRDLAGVVAGGGASVDEAEEAAVRAVLALLRRRKGEQPGLADANGGFQAALLKDHN